MNPTSTYAKKARVILKELVGDYNIQLSLWKDVLRKTRMHPIKAALMIEKRFNIDQISALWLIVAVDDLIKKEKKK